MLNYISEKGKLYRPIEPGIQLSPIKSHDDMAESWAGQGSTVDKIEPKVVEVAHTDERASYADGPYSNEDMLRLKGEMLARVRNRYGEDSLEMAKARLFYSLLKTQANDGWAN